MKKILSFIIKVFFPKHVRIDAADEKIFEQLDGAEFYVVLPPVKPQTTVEGTM